MKIVHVVDSASRLGGGLSESVKGLAGAMHAAGADITVVAATDAAIDADRASWGATPLVLARADRRSDLLLGRGIAAALSALSPDLVHLHGLWGVGARGTAAWQRRHGRALVVSPHGMLDAWAMARGAAKKRISRAIWEGPMLGRAAFLHALAEPEAASIAAAGFERPVLTVPNGVDLPALDPAAVAPARRQVLLFVGRLHPKKGLSELLRAWALLPAALRDRWIVRIAGWDEIGLQAALETEAAALGIAGSVDFAGPVYGAHKDETFRDASAFILPSHSEGLPMVILEAWAYGLPVMMTAACNLPQGFASDAAIEIVTEPAAMARTMAMVLPEAARLRAIGDHGRALVERDHGWPAIARTLLGAYARGVR